MNTLSVFRPTPSLYETKFHRGFQRRRSCDHEHQRADISIQAFKRYNQRVETSIAAFNASKCNTITGEGYPEPVARGKRSGERALLSYEGERVREYKRRVIGSNYRFFSDWIRPQTSPRVTKCESVIIGSDIGRKRNRTTSLGIFDNFQHTQEPLSVPSSSMYRNHLSQICFG